jgi:zinc protease
MRFPLIAVALSSSLAAACAPKPAPPFAPTTPDIPKIAFDKYTLPNGLYVILSDDHRIPMVAVNLWYHVGPANEGPGRTGFAHLFEHMMFQGSKHVEGDSHFRLLEGAGASDYNGTTDFDRTNYFETLPSNQLDLALWLESDRMGYLLDVLDQPNLANQQAVVRNERRQNTENVPYGIVGEAEFHQLFPATHPYNGDVIGSHADIQAAKLAEVKSFFKTYYAPNNASLAIVGDIDKAKTRALVEKYFGPLKRGPEVPKVTAATPPVTTERRVVVPDKVQLDKVYLGWITPAFYKPGDADADLAGQILGGGKSSRLYKKLVYEQQIAQDVTASQESLTLGSVFTITATARAGHKAAELEQAIDAELARFQAEGPTAQEMERARNIIETSIVSGLETLGGFGGVADMLNRYNHYLGTPDYLGQDIQRYRSASAESVKAFAASQLQKHSRAVVYGVPGTPKLAEDPRPPATQKAAPGTGAEAINADEPWRKSPPAAGPVSAPTLAPPSSFTLANGLTVIVSERPHLPVVSMSMVVRTGSGANPPAQSGLANFADGMLDEGTTNRNALKLADDIAQIGASLSTSSSMDSSRVQVSALKKNLGPAMDLLADVTLHPAFPADEVDRQRMPQSAHPAQILLTCAGFPQALTARDPHSGSARSEASISYPTKRPKGGRRGQPPPFRVSRAIRALLGHAGRLADLVGDLDHVNVALHVDLRQPLQPLRQVPVAVAQELHRRGHQDRPHDRRVQEDRDREAEAHLLQRRDPTARERREHRDHDHGRAGDDAARGPQAVGDRLGVVLGLVVLLADPAQQEHLVVHRKAEQDREEEQRQPRLDRLDLGEVEGVGDRVRP